MDDLFSCFGQELKLKIGHAHPAAQVLKSTCRSEFIVFRVTLNRYLLTPFQIISYLSFFLESRHLKFE
jgi:hypothetical protein